MKETLEIWEDWKRAEEKATEKKWQKLKSELIRELNITCYEAVCNVIPELEFEFDLGCYRDFDGNWVVNGECRNCGRPVSFQGIPLPEEYQGFAEYSFEGKNPTVAELQELNEIKDVAYKISEPSFPQLRLPLI